MEGTVSSIGGKLQERACNEVVDGVLAYIRQQSTEKNQIDARECVEERQRERGETVHRQG